VLLTAVPTTINEGSATSLTGTASDASGIDRVVWTFGDGTADTTVTVNSNPNVTTSNNQNKTYADNGAYTVRFRAYDKDNPQTFADRTVNITVNNVAPQNVNPGAPRTVVEGSLQSFAGLATDPGADTLTYTWAWGDGTDNTAGQNVTHTFADQGTFTVTLTATDDDGAATSATTTVTVTNANPTITPVPDQTGTQGPTR
jgi:PKD repeat protein